MAIDDFVLLVLHDDDIAVECADPAGDPCFVLQDYSNRCLFGAVHAQHLVEEVGFHGGVLFIG